MSIYHKPTSEPSDVDAKTLRCLHCGVHFPRRRGFRTSCGLLRGAMGNAGRRVVMMNHHLLNHGSYLNNALIIIRNGYSLNNLLS